MNEERIKKIVEPMEPREAASVLARVMKGLFSLLDKDARLQFIVDLTGGVQGRRGVQPGPPLTGRMRGRGCRPNENV